MGDVHEPGITALHFIDNPALALLVANICIPCWQRNTDGLGEKGGSEVHIRRVMLQGFTHMWRVWWDGVANRLIERQHDAWHFGQESSES